MKKNSTDSRKARAMLTVSRVLVYALLIFLSVLCLFSFYMLIVNASRTNADLQGGFKALPQGHFLENLKNAWNDSSINIPRGMLNSFIIAAATAILSTYFSALTAYGLHAYNFKLKRLAFLFIMAVMVIPKQVSAAGFVQLCYKLKLTNSYLPLILPSIAAPVVFFYMIQYMKSVLPMEIVEAERVAGSVSVNTCGSSCSTEVMQRGFLQWMTFLIRVGSLSWRFSTCLPSLMKFTVMPGST